MIRRPALILTFFLSGCSLIPSVGPNYSEPRILDEAAWSSEVTRLLAAENRVVPAQPEQWWKELGDPTLNNIIEEIVRKNIDVALAGSRLRQARAELTQAEASFFPELVLGANYTKRKQSENSIQGRIISGVGGADQGNRTGPNLNQRIYQGALDASWEIDIFGGVRRQVEAADALLQSAEDSERAAVVSAVAEGARIYFDLRALHRRLKLTKENIQAQEGILGIAETRFNAGLTNELDVSQARAQVETTRSALPTLEAQYLAQRNALGILLDMNAAQTEAYLNTQPNNFHEPLSHLPTSFDLTSPATTITNRPDVKASERQVAAANALLGAAVAAQYPQFFLGGSLGLESLRASDFFDSASKTWSFGPSFSIPIFSGGRIIAEVDVQTEQERQAMLNYRKTVLTALSEAEASISNYMRERERLQSLVVALDSQRTSLRLSEELYKKGLADFLRVLESERSTFAAEDQVAQSEGALGSRLSAVYKALGLGWQNFRPLEVEVLQ